MAKSLMLSVSECSVVLVDSNRANLGFEEIPKIYNKFSSKMSIFVQPGTKRKPMKLSKPSRKVLENDEIESSDDDDDLNHRNGSRNVVDEDEEDDDAVETVQEKRFRLAKEYLADIENQELDKSETDEFRKEAIAHRLRDDVLEQTGRLHKKIADQILKPNFANFRTFRGHKLSPTCVAVTNDSSKIISGSKDGSLILWDLKSGKKLKLIKGLTKLDGALSSNGHRGQVRCIAVSSDDKFLCSAGTDKMIQVWDLLTMQHLKEFRGHSSTITGLSFRRGQNQLFSCGEDRAVKVWNLDEMGYVDTMFGHVDAIADIDSLTKERTITCGGRDRTIRIWKLVEESQLVFHAHAGCGSIECLSLINEDHFVSGADDGSLSIWSLMKKKPACVQLKAHFIENSDEPCWISSVCASKFTDLIASGSHDGYIKLWQCSENYKSLTLIHVIPVIGFVNSICFTADNSSLICAVGQEHKSGRWWREKSSKNSIIVCPLERKTL